MSAARSFPFASDAWRIYMSDRPPELATLRHRTASGHVDSFWEFLPEGGFPTKPNRILAVVKLGSAKPVEIEVPVCSHRNTLAERWIIVRRSETTFLLTAAHMPRNYKSEIARSTRFHPDLPIGSLVLTDAPPEVAAELAALGC